MGKGKQKYVHEHRKIQMEGFPEYTRDGGVQKRTRKGGFETTHEKQMEAAIAASTAAETLQDMGSPNGRPVIGEQVPPGVVLPPSVRRIAARAAQCPAPRAPP